LVGEGCGRGKEGLGRGKEGCVGVMRGIFQNKMTSFVSKDIFIGFFNIIYKS
jgi:hypothetical protein